MKTEPSIVIRHAGAAIIFSAIGVWGSLNLISRSIIGEASFIGLIIFTFLAAILIAFMWKVQSFKFGAGSLEVKLKEIKEAESNIKDLAKAIYEAVDSDSGSLKYESWDEERYNRAIENLRKFAE